MTGSRPRSTISFNHRCGSEGFTGTLMMLSRSALRSRPCCPAVAIIWAQLHRRAGAEVISLPVSDLEAGTPSTPSAAWSRTCFSSPSECRPSRRQIAEVGDPGHYLVRRALFRLLPFHARSLPGQLARLSCALAARPALAGIGRRSMRAMRCDSSKAVSSIVCPGRWKRCGSAPPLMAIPLGISV